MHRLQIVQDNHVVCQIAVVDTDKITAKLELTTESLVKTLCENCLMEPGAYDLFLYREGDNQCVDYQQKPAGGCLV